MLTRTLTAAEIDRCCSHFLEGNESPETREGWALLQFAVRTRVYARGRVVTAAATLAVNDYPDESVGTRGIAHCTFFGRGPTIEAAVEDLGRSGAF